MRRDNNPANYSTRTPVYTADTDKSLSISNLNGVSLSDHCLTCKDGSRLEVLTCREKRTCPFYKDRIIKESGI